MKVTVASVFLVLVVLATSMSSAEGRKTSRRVRGYNEDDALLEQYANVGLGRDLKGKKKKSNIFQTKAPKATKAPTVTVTKAPKATKAPTVTVTKAPKATKAPTVTVTKAPKATKAPTARRRL